MLRVFTSNSWVCVRSNTFRVMSFCFPCRKKVISCYIENSPERIRSSTSGKAISKKASYSFDSSGYPRKIHTGGSVRRSIPSFYMPLSTARVPLLYTRILVLMMAIFDHILGHNHQEQIFLDQPWWFSRFIVPENFTYRGPNTSLQTSTRCHWRQRGVKHSF